MTMKFGEALTQLETGRKIAREGWNGKGMWLIYVPAIHNITSTPGTPYHKAGVSSPFTIDAHIDMMTVRGTMQPGWAPSQSDMLAKDWHVVDNK